MGDLRELIARQGHDIYERLAPKFGYKTRGDTKEFDPDSPNGKLMIAVYGEIRSIVLDEAIKAINADVSFETADRYNAIEDAICVIERLK
jgi:hypothetical protein